MSTELELFREVHHELADSEYATRTHGRVATYMWGCRGPLCRKANRDYRREQYAKRAAQAGAVPRENAPRQERAFDALIDVLRAQHEEERTARTDVAS